MRPTEASAPPRKNRVRTFLLGAATAGIVTASGVAAAQALTAVQAQHFAQCLGWLLTDPDVHAQNCLPGHMPGPGSLAEKGSPPAPEPEYTYIYEDAE